MEKFPYQDASLPVERRVEDLLGRMTLEEKVGQMCQLDGRVNLEQEFQEKHPGLAAPDSRRGLQKGDRTRPQLPPRHPAAARRRCDPRPLVLAGRHDLPDPARHQFQLERRLIEEMGRVTAAKCATPASPGPSPRALHRPRPALGPGRRNLRRGPLLIGDFAIALIRGLQGENLSSPDKVLACAKHFTGYSETQGGRDASEADISMRKLRSYFLPPFERPRAPESAPS